MSKPPTVKVTKCIVCNREFLPENNRVKKVCSYKCRLKRNYQIMSESRKANKFREEVYKRDNFTCVYCDRKREEGVYLVLDHKIPLKAGGLSLPENLLTSCVACNSQKSDMTYQEFKEKIITQ